MIQNQKLPWGFDGRDGFLPDKFGCCDIYVSPKEGRLATLIKDWIITDMQIKSRHSGPLELDDDLIEGFMKTDTLWPTYNTTTRPIHHQVLRLLHMDGTQLIHT